MSQTHASSRREFLRRAPLAAAGIAAVAGATPVTADAQLAPRAPSAQPPKRLRAQLPRKFAGVNAVQMPWQLDPTEEWENWSLRLARRVTLGLTAEEAQRARALGYSGYLNYHLNHEAIDDTAVETFVRTKWPNLALTGVDIYAMDAGQLQTQLQEATLYRAAFSKRQLYQRVVEFWSDHFNIAMSKAGYLKVLDDREVIRKYAMTTFPQLLKASAHSAAMLVYLDQFTSRRQSPNQNYAREIMELHTLGVEGAYTQQDVAELSRILTGWTVAGRGDFAFSPSLHDFTAKTFLGTAFPAMNALNQTNPQGVTEGEQVLDMLVKHPDTAKFIATKMLRWFLWYEPSKAMVDAVSAVYTTTGGDIKSMLRAIAELRPHAAGAGEVQAPVPLARLGPSRGESDGHGARGAEPAAEFVGAHAVHLGDPGRLPGPGGVLGRQPPAAVERVDRSLELRRGRGRRRGGHPVRR